MPDAADLIETLLSSSCSSSSSSSSSSSGREGWTKNLALNHTALLAEMAGIVMGADKPLEMDKWIEFIKDTLCRLLKVDVPNRLILQVMSPMVPFHVAPTPASALHLLRSGWCSKLLGPALAAQTNKLLLAENADVPVQLHSDEALSLSVRAKHDSHSGELALWPTSR